MEFHRLSIGAREFFLSSPEAMEELKGNITGALKDGGGWVEIVSARHRSVSVLITAGSHVTAETFEAADNDSDDETEHAPFDDY